MSAELHASAESLVEAFDDLPADLKPLALRLLEAVVLLLPDPQPAAVAKPLHVARARPVKRTAKAKAHIPRAPQPSVRVPGMPR